MRWTIVLAVPFIGGCFSPAVLRDPSQSPYPSAVSRAAGENSAARNGARAAEKENTGFVLRPNIDNLVPDSSTEDLGADEEFTSFLSDDEALPEELPDADTLADNLALSGVGENPPEDEGVTVSADISFDFPVVENEKVNYYIDYFTGPVRHVFTRWLERSGRYVPMMQAVFQEEGLPLDLTYLAMVESGFNNRAYSWAHAAGPWQFIESTGRIYGLKADGWRDERRDFEKSTRAAARFLKHLHERFKGDWYLAIASYNCGPGRVERAISKGEVSDFWELSRQNLLPEETRNYVPKMLAALIIAKQPEKYGFSEIDYQEPLAYDVVEVDTPTDLEVVARLCNVSHEDVKNLNPELKRWCTPPGQKNYVMRIPAGAAEGFEKAYAALPESERAGYMRYKIRRGDSLHKIAKRFHVRVDEIIALNKVSNPRGLRIGEELVIPAKDGKYLSLANLENDFVTTKKVSYKVRRGDTLGEIARQFGVSIHDLRAWNRLGRRSIIRTGQQLVVVSAVGKKTNVASVARKSGKGSSQVMYKVRSGDSLWTIARRFKVSTDELRSWNGLSRKHVLRPGDTLTIMAQAESGASGKRKIVYRVKHGDTLWDIGRRYDVAAQQIMDWNDMSEGHTLKPGDQLTLLVGEGVRG